MPPFLQGDCHLIEEAKHIQKTVSDRTWLCLDTEWNNLMGKIERKGFKVKEWKMKPC